MSPELKSSAAPDIRPELCNCSALRQAARHVTRFYDDVLSTLDLGLNQYAVLAKLDRFGPTVLRDLAARLVMDRSSLGHLLRPIETRGLVTIGVSETDRRQRLIALTPTGIDLLHAARPLWAKAEHRFEQVFGPNDAVQLRTMLKRVATAEFGRA